MTIYQSNTAHASSNDLERIASGALPYVRDYIARGWHAFPLSPQSKNPLPGWSWTKTRVDNELAQVLFSSTVNNVAVALGERSNGLIDLDLDWAEARLLADAILSELPAFGRPGAQRSHRLAICGDGSEILKFRLPSICKNDPLLPEEHSLCVAELRGTGGYTMFPGSIHPNGEQVTWEPAAPDKLPDYTWDQLRARVGLLAFLGVIVRWYPGTGSRDECCMALTGTLLRSEVLNSESRVDDVDNLVTLVAELAHDEEYRSRKKATATWRKMQSGEAVTGLPTLLQLLGLPEEVGKTFREWIRIGPEGDGRPIIRMGSEDLKLELDRAEVALESAKAPIFQRGRNLVRVIRQDYQSQQTPGMQRHAGALSIEEVEPYWLSEQLQKAAIFEKRLSGKAKSGKPTHEFCNHLIVGRRGQWRWSVLKGIIETPTLRPDWTVLQQPGYDASTRLFLDFGDTAFQRIPDNPTRQEAEESLHKFIEVIRRFPFAPDSLPDDWAPDAEEGRQPSASRSVILSAWLTGLIRPSLRTAPLHAIDAPTMGTGKSKLADIIAVTMTGRCASVVSQAPTEEEMEKRLCAMLYAGDQVIAIDNIERPLEAAALCSILTQEKWKGRILGKSETPELPTAALFLATCNNLTFRGDMTRRAVTCRLDARSERPDERTFDFDPVELARRNREDLVVAGLTIIRSYIAAGQPLKGTIPHVGSFEDWTLIREVLMWLGQPDPASTRSQVLADDPIRAELAKLMDDWARCYGSRSMTIAQVKQDVEKAKQNPFSDFAFQYSDLGSILKELTGTDEINAKRLGWWFKRHGGIVVNGRHFERDNSFGGDLRYRLVSQNTSRE